MVENMVYSNLAVQYYAHSDMGKLAGVQDEWKRAMLLKDGVLIDKKFANTSAVLVCPVSVLVNEKADMKSKAGKEGVSIIDEVCAPLGVIDFYICQKEISSTDQNIFVIDVWDTFTEISYIKNMGGIRRIEDSKRLDFGYEQLIDKVFDWFIQKLVGIGVIVPVNSSGAKDLRMQVYSLVYRMSHSRQIKDTVTFQLEKRKKKYSLQIKRSDFEVIVTEMLMSIVTATNCMRVIHNIKLGKLILSGTFFECTEIVKEIKARIDLLDVLSYKAGEASVLGAACYSFSKYGGQRKYSLDDTKIQYNQKYKLGSVCNLTADQQTAYWKILDAVMNRKSEVMYKGFCKDISIVYSALRNDYPEVDIIWDYSSSQIWENDHKLNVTLLLKYKTDGNCLLTNINQKVYDIINAGLKGNMLSDQEILEEIYCYMSKQYHYTKEQTQDGHFPSHAYTLETLLRFGVCRGYAISMVYILRKLQIPSTYISGDADGNEFGGHAWNIIQLSDGTYRHFDMTWDLGKSRIKEYFLLDDISMKARKHFWKTLDYPECA